MYCRLCFIDVTDTSIGTTYQLSKRGAYHFICYSCAGKWIQNSVETFVSYFDQCKGYEQVIYTLIQEVSHDVREILNDYLWQRYCQINNHEIVQLPCGHTYSISQDLRGQCDVISCCERIFCSMCGTEESVNCCTLPSWDKLAKRIHSCPFCHCKIEKTGGCNQMSCKLCTLKFCWICLKRQDTRRKFRHIPKCKCIKRIHRSIIQFYFYLLIFLMFVVITSILYSVLNNR